MSAPATGDAAASAGRQIARNSALLGTGHAFGMVLGFATTLMVTDLLGEAYGDFIGAQRFAMLFMVIAEFGLNPLMVRAMAREPGNAGVWLGGVAVSRVALSVVFVGVVWVAAVVGDYLPDQRALLFAFVAISVLQVAATTLLGLFDGLEQMGRSAIVSFARAAALFAVMVGVYSLGGGLREVVMAYLVSGALQVVTGLFLTRGTGVDVRPVVDLERIREMLRAALWFVAVGGAFSALRALDVVLLTRLSTTDQVAQYGAALNFLEVLFVLPILVQRALLPAFSRLGGGDEGGRTLRDTLRIFSAILIPSAIGLGLLAERAVALYPSGEFAGAAPVLRVLAGSLVLLGPATVCATYLTGVGRLPTLLAAYAIILPVQVALCVFAIPRGGAVGVAWVTVASHGLLLVLLAIAVVRAGGGQLPLGGFARQALAGLGMAAVVVATRDWLLPIPMLAGGLTYGALLLWLSGSDGLERRLVRLATSRFGSA